MSETGVHEGNIKEGDELLNSSMLSLSAVSLETRPGAKLERRGCEERAEKRGGSAGPFGVKSCVVTYLICYGHNRGAPGCDKAQTCYF